MRRAFAAVAVCITIGALACVSDRTSGPSGTLDGCNAELPAEAFGSTIVIIRDFAFTPADVRVRAGAKVTWVNCSAPADASHTSTSDTGVWGSEVLPAGATFTREFPQAGVFPYHCTPHPFMRGTVTVE